VFSAILARGQHVVGALPAGRSAWLYVVAGNVIVGDIVLNVGDGLGFTAERSVSARALENSEILLIDLGTESPGNSTPARCGEGPAKILW
jgi:redox-sensitive bicupin YhaK (pirin superfamily)